MTDGQGRGASQPLGPCRVAWQGTARSQHHQAACNTSSIKGRPQGLTQLMGAAQTPPGYAAESCENTGDHVDNFTMYLGWLILWFGYIAFGVATLWWYGMRREFLDNAFEALIVVVCWPIIVLVALITTAVQRASKRSDDS